MALLMMFGVTAMDTAVVVAFSDASRPPLVAISWALVLLVEARVLLGVVRSKATKSDPPPAPVGYYRVLLATACGNATPILLALASVYL